MLRYTLACDQGHEFEGWFSGSAGFDDQARRGLLSCPICGSGHVAKAIMAPSVARRDRLAAQPQGLENSAPTVGGTQPGDTPAMAGAPAIPAPVALISEEEKGLRAAFKALRTHVETHAENVGTDFAATARQIHEGEIEPKSIYGVATPDEVSALHEDGIEAHPLPILPEERN